MIEVVSTSDIENDAKSHELCAICYKLTPFWYPPKDVAVCGTCSLKVDHDEVPSKEEWWDSVENHLGATIHIGSLKAEVKIFVEAIVDKYEKIGLPKRVIELQIKSTIFNLIKAKGKG